MREENVVKVGLEAIIRQLTKAEEHFTEGAAAMVEAARIWDMYADNHAEALGVDTHSAQQYSEGIRSAFGHNPLSAYVTKHKVLFQAALDGDTTAFDKAAAEAVADAARLGKTSV